MVDSNRIMFAKNAGFTLVELIVTMTIIGILAFAVVPRFNQNQSFESRSFFDRSLAMVRYAQKAAIAQSTVVFVNTNAAGNTICLSYANDANCNGGSGVPDPVGQNRYLHIAPDGVTLPASVGFSFSPLGRATQGVTLGIVGDGTTRTITVEQETGYVH